MLPRIDIARLTIPGTILGIDMNEERARIVSLRRVGNRISKNAHRFKVAHSMKVGFGVAFTCRQKSDALRLQLELAKIRTRYVCAVVYTPGIKIVKANVPASVEDIDEWIHENHERLLGFPVAFKEFTFSYELLGADERQSTIDVTFVRNSDIELCCEILEGAGLRLLSLGAGTRDAVNSLLLENDQDKGFMFVTANSLCITAIRAGVRSEVRKIPINNPGLLNEVSTTLGELGLREDNVFLSGEGLKSLNLPFTIHKPFGLEPYYTLAAGLALKGFLPEISPTDFLSEGARVDVSVSLQRSLFQQVALALGAILMVLLIGQMGILYFIQSKIDRLDDQVFSSSSDYSEIETLQQQIVAIERKLSLGTRYYSTNFARSLYDLASATPDSVWLSHLNIEKRDGKQASVVIGGSSKRNKHVTSYLKKLSNEAGCTDVNIVRSGIPVQDEFGISARRRSSITFEITADLNTK